MIPGAAAADPERYSRASSRSNSQTRSRQESVQDKPKLAELVFLFIRRLRVSCLPPVKIICSFDTRRGENNESSLFRHGDFSKFDFCLFSLDGEEILAFSSW